MNSNAEAGKLTELSPVTRQLAGLLIEQARRNGFDAEVDAIRSGSVREAARHQCH